MGSINVGRKRVCSWKGFQALANLSKGIMNVPFILERPFSIKDPKHCAAVISGGVPLAKKLVIIVPTRTEFRCSLCRREGVCVSKQRHSAQPLGDCLRDIFEKLA